MRCRQRRLRPRAQAGGRHGRHVVAVALSGTQRHSAAVHSAASRSRVRARRSAIVDRTGREINSNRFIALMVGAGQAAAQGEGPMALRESPCMLGTFTHGLLTLCAQESVGHAADNVHARAQAAVTLREHPGTTIVTDSVTSNGLADFIAGLGGKHIRCATAPVRTCMGSDATLGAAAAVCMRVAFDTAIMVTTCGCCLQLPEL